MGILPVFAGRRTLAEPKADLDDVVRLHAHGVNPQTIVELHALGYDDLQADDAIRLNNHGVSPGFVRKLVEAGFDELTVAELIDIHNRGEADSMIRRRASLEG